MTLTQTAKLFKQVVFLASIFVILSIIAFIGYKAAYNYYVTKEPPPVEKPDIRFGQLPPPPLPQSTALSSNFTYSLDTVTGFLPKMEQDAGFKNIVKVYFVNRPVATLLSPERATIFAKGFNITTPPQILSETLYRFFQDNKTLTINTDTQNFKYANTAVPKPLNRLTESEAQLSAGFVGVLSRVGAFKPDLESGPSKVTLLKEKDEKLVPVTSKNEALYAHISLWQKFLDDKMIHSPKFNVSLISALVAGPSGNLNNYLSIEYTFWAIDRTSPATYPAKSIDIAFDQLKSGKGVVVVSPKTSNVSITSISTAYYMPEEYLPFLYPIYVFEGPQFAAYVSALDEASIAGPTQNLNTPTQ